MGSLAISAGEPVERHNRSNNRKHKLYHRNRERGREYLTLEGRTEHTRAAVMLAQTPKRREHGDIAHEQKDDVHREEDPKDVGALTQRNLEQ